MISIVTGVIGILAAVVIIVLMRRDNLHAQHGLGWIIVALGFAFLGFSPGVIDSVAKQFGVAWIRDGKINNFKTLLKDHGVPEMKLQLLSKRLREAYEKNDTASRFSATISDQKIVVTESVPLAKELKEIIQ